jgi:GNAT superfamily N-acetyltransferase
MNASLRIRLLTRAHLPFADSVRALAGWNQTIADWERFLAAAPDGCFLAEWDGAPAGTATTIIYSSTVAWIGMVLVHPIYRRRGVGRALLARCIEYLRERGVRCIKLDATPAGKQVYDGLGFKDEWTLTRWEHAGAHWRADSPPGIRECRDIDTVEPLDAIAFGISRRRMLEPLMKQSRCALVCEAERDKVVSYGLLRDGSNALYLGPLVAVSDGAGVRLANGLLARAADRKIFWDIPDQNVAAVAHAKKLGFTPQRTLTRMYLGENAAPGNPLLQFAIAGPEVG